MSGGVLWVVGDFILLIVLADIVLRIELKFFPLFLHFEIPGSVFDDIGGLIPEDFPGEIRKDLLEACWHWVLL